MVRQLALSWGVHPFLLAQQGSPRELVDAAVSCARDLGGVKAGDRVIAIVGDPVGVVGDVNIIEVKEVE